MQADDGGAAGKGLAIDDAGLGLKAAAARGNHHLIAEAPAASGEDASAVATDVFGEAGLNG